MRIISIASLVVTLMVLASIPIPAAGHSLTFVNASLKYVCVPGNSGVGTLQYDNQGPANKNWAIQLRVINAGDQYQGVYFNSSVTDNANQAEVGRVRHAARNWIDAGGQVAGSMAPHAGSSFDMVTTIFNYDASSHCFWLLVIAGYE